MEPVYPSAPAGSCTPTAAIPAIAAVALGARSGLAADRELTNLFRARFGVTPARARTRHGRDQLVRAPDTGRSAASQSLLAPVGDHEAIAAPEAGSLNPRCTFDTFVAGPSNQPALVFAGAHNPAAARIARA